MTAPVRQREWLQAGMTNSKVIVHMPGGDLQVEIEDDWNVYMTGDVFYVAKLTLSNEFTEKLRNA